MQNALIIKTGYTAGISGNTGEIFCLVQAHKQGFSTYYFNGMYGSEWRIKKLLETQGWRVQVNSGYYGRLTAKEAKGAINEYAMIELLKETK